MVMAGILLILAGWWLLAIAMPPRQSDPARRRRLRLAGACALASSLACYLFAIGVEQGAVFWAAALMLGAMAVAVVRAFARPGEEGHARRGRATR